jgi:hypothetical protein
MISRCLTKIWAANAERRLFEERRREPLFFQGAALSDVVLGAPFNSRQTP